MVRAARAREGAVRSRARVVLRLPGESVEQRMAPADWCLIPAPAGQARNWRMPPRILPRTADGERSVGRNRLALALTMPFRERPSAEQLLDRDGACLQVSERAIRRIAREHGPRTPIA